MIHSRMCSCLIKFVELFKLPPQKRPRRIRIRVFIWFTSSLPSWLGSDRIIHNNGLLYSDNRRLDPKQRLHFPCNRFLFRSFILAISRSGRAKKSCRSFYKIRNCCSWVLTKCIYFGTNHECDAGSIEPPSDHSRGCS